MIKTFKITSSEKKKMSEKITSFLKDKKEIVFVYLYGSFVYHKSFRDLDLALYLKGIKKERITDYILETSVEIERIVNFPVDVRSLNNAPIDYQYNVVSGRILFSKDEELRSRFVERVVSRYLDMAPMVRYYLKEAMT